MSLETSRTIVSGHVQNNHDNENSARIQRLETDLDLIQAKLKSDSEASQLQLQLLRTELNDQLKMVKEEFEEQKKPEAQHPVILQSQDELMRLLGERDKELMGEFERLLKEKGEELVQPIKESEQIIEQAIADLREEINQLQQQNSQTSTEHGKYENDEEAEKNEFEHHYLPNDAYSFLAVANYFEGCFPTCAFLLAVLVPAVQIVTLVIFMNDVVDNGNMENLLSVPVGVSSTVRVSQLIALLISCWNQDEMRASFNVFSLGYNIDRLYTISPGASCTKWYFSILVRFSLGCLSLLVTFLLVINSETVRDVMLDFVAVTFVSELDNAAFLFSLWGYMGKSLQRLTLNMKSTPVHKSKDQQSSNDETSRSCGVKVTRLISMIFIFTIVFVCWAWITTQQLRGNYMEETIFVQFGDDFSPTISAFSGLYQIEIDDKPDGMRVDYVELGTGRAMFTYCLKNSMWLFQYGIIPNKENHDFSNECWFKARSSETLVLDMEQMSTLPWYVLDEKLSLEMPLQHFYVKGQKHYYGKSCQRDDDCGDRMLCEENNNSESYQTAAKSCVCKEGHFGVNCEFLNPCQSLEIDPRDTNGFFGTRSWSRRFSSVQEDGENSPIQVYGKPIFFGDVDSREGDLDVMIFTGRRWILTDTTHIEGYESSSLWSDDNCSTTRARRNLAKILANTFHAYWSNYTFYFASEPVDVGTPTDSATPVGLQWFRLATDGAKGVSLQSEKNIWQGMMSIDANLFCAVCHNETNPCFYGASCLYDGTCSCTTGSSGRLCQIPPDGNGFCDVFFNTPQFSFDGGDCCQETCISTEQHTCGKGMIENAGGMYAYGFVGYPNCKDPKFSSKLHGSTTLGEIVERGTLRCGCAFQKGFMERVDGVYSGFDVDLCKSIAAAALGNPEAIEIVITSAYTRFADLTEGKYDILLGGITYNAERDIHQSDTGTGFSFATPYLYDGVRYGGIPPFSQCADKIDFESPECSGLKICVAEFTTWFLVTENLFPHSMIVAVETIQAEYDGLQAGLCNVIAGETFDVAEFAVREGGFIGPAYDVGENIHSREPLAAVMREDDRVWNKFVSWVIEALIEAEESGVTKSTADQLAPTDAFGEQFRNIFQHALGANGNYGEMYKKNLENIFPRSGLNTINKGNSGLIYSFPFGAFQTRGQDPVVRGSIEAIQKRGFLNCGICPSPPFAEFDVETGNWRGFDVDMCRGIASALLRGSPNVNFISLVYSNRFTTLADGIIDILTCGTTHTLMREMQETTTGEGFDFTPAIFHDGMSFAGRAPFVSCAEFLIFDNSTVSACPKTRICVRDETTWLEAIRGKLGIREVNIFVTTSHEESYERLIAGDCNVIAGESFMIAETKVRDRGYLDDYFISATTFTKEPLAVVSRSDDIQFSDFLRWVVFGFFYAAEQGITQEDFFKMPSAMFLFGNSLSGMWQDAIEIVGNYDEIFARNFDGFLERQGLNKLNSENGPQFFAKPGVMIN